MAVNDNLDKLFFQGISSPKLFCSEVVISLKSFDNQKELQEINIAEKYRVLGRKEKVFDYVNLVEKDLPILYLKICLKDLMQSCKKMSFYVNRSGVFELMTTQS